jgi:predicted nucleic acid-binding protein
VSSTCSGHLSIRGRLTCEPVPCAARRQAVAPVNPGRPVRDDTVGAGYLLDTNTVSEARKPGGDIHVKSWLAAVSAGDLYLSALAIGEIRRGIERLRRRDPTQAAMYEAWLATLLRGYADRILPITADIAEEWGRINAPDPVPAIDGLMAATAKVHNLTFVTRSTADVARTGVRLLNPFELQR